MVNKRVDGRAAHMLAPEAVGDDQDAFQRIVRDARLALDLALIIEDAHRVALHNLFLLCISWVDPHALFRVAFRF